MDGKIHVGCGLKELERLGRDDEPKMKVSRRDFAYALSQRVNGGTTVAGTLVVAGAVGIRLFATGKNSSSLPKKYLGSV
jgi:pseudouridine-5'-phosphate glycosidase